MTYLLLLLAFFLGPNVDSPSAASPNPVKAATAAGSVATCEEPAESLAGTYSLVGNDAVEATLIEIPFIGWYSVWVTVDGQVQPNETGFMKPQDDGGYKYKNAVGNEGDMTPTDAGMSLVMTTGDNKGKKTTWTKNS